MICFFCLDSEDRNARGVEAVVVGGAVCNLAPLRPGMTDHLSLVNVNNADCRERLPSRLFGAREVVLRAV